MAPLVDPLYAPAEVSQVSPSALPILSAGLLTLPIVHQFDNTCHRYFSIKDMDVDDDVTKILYNFKSVAIQSWVMAEEDMLLAMSFNDFLVAFKKNSYCEPGRTILCKKR